MEFLVEFFVNLGVKGVITQSFGVLGFIAAMILFQQKTQKKIVAFQLVCASMFTIHMFLLGGIAGFLLNAIAIVRACVFYFRNDKKWAASPVWVVVFSVLSISASVFCYVKLDEHWAAFFPMIGMIITTVSFSLRKAFHVRLITLANSPCWMVYNIKNGSFAGIITELTIFTSIIIAIFRIDLRKRTGITENTDSEINIDAEAVNNCSQK